VKTLLADAVPNDTPHPERVDADRSGVAADADGRKPVFYHETVRTPDMSSNVFVAPCDPDGFDRTVRSAVSLADYPDHPDALPDETAVRFWGVRDGDSNETHFEKMEAGDLVLFYDDDAYVGTGRVGTTFTDDESWASATFWDGAPATRVFTVDDFTPVTVPKAAVNRIFDYADGYDPRGLMRVADGRVSKRPAAIELAMERYSEKHG